MHRIFNFIFAIFFILNCSQLYAETGPQVDEIKQIVTAFMQKNKIPGVAVEGYVDGKPYDLYFGYADKAKNMPVNKDTIFELGSISKVMTGVLFAQQVDYAKVSLHDSIRKYIKDLPEQYNPITLQDLATNASGLPFNPPQNIKNKSELISFLEEWSPQTGAGKRWIYSNLGVGVLGIALEAESKKSFDELYNKRVLAPLKMERIAFDVPNRIKQNYAQGYDKSNQPVSDSIDKVLPAANSIKVRAGDMQQFLSASIGLPGTPADIFYPMRLSQSVFLRMPNKLQGLGWQIHPLNAETIPTLLSKRDEKLLNTEKILEVLDQPLFNGDYLHDKEGITKGFASYIAVIPNKKAGIVILANKSINSSEIVNAGREILFRLADVAPAKR